MTRKKRSDREPAGRFPVARVCVDNPLPHLDRLFDYLVPAELAENAQPGVRVRVRFSGKLSDGWLLERVAESDHPGRLEWLERVISAEQVLTPDIVALARASAERYAGNLSDVLRLAVPPRHAKVEGERALTRIEAAPPGAEGPQTRIEGAQPPLPEPAGWARYQAGPAFLRALQDGARPRAVWSALPGEDWPGRIAEAVAATVAGGRAVVAVVADARDLDRLDAALQAQLGPDRHVALSAALGPAERYRRFLRALRGEVAVVIGTRAAAFAPLGSGAQTRLGLVAIWDDGDDVHAEPRAPYPHTRNVLLTRAELSDTAVLVAGYARTAEAQQLVASGWAREIVADRAAVRAAAPRIEAGDEQQSARDPAAASARLPSLAWQAAREALAADAAVLVQVPRYGYVPAVSCQACRERARCAHCAGPLQLGSQSAAAARMPSCRWCGRPAAGYACPACGGHRLRAAVTGVQRTAEELGRAFPGIPVRVSGRGEVLDRIPGGAALVLATPGAEPVADGGYGAALLLDSWALLTRADLRAVEEAARRWFNAAALTRPGVRGGRVIVIAEGSLPPVQALVRWDPGWLAERELAERRTLGFPPATRMAAVTGKPESVAELLQAAGLADEPALLGRAERLEGAELLGPLPVGDEERMLIRVRRSGALALARALHAAAGVRSARKADDVVRIQLEPTEL